MGIAIANRKNRCDFGALVRASDTPSPKLRGVNLHPLNLGGMGLQGNLSLHMGKIVRISGFSSLSQRSQCFVPSDDVLKNTAIAEKREESPEILTNLVRKGLTFFVC